MFKLVIQDDEGKTTVVPLIRDEITIGRKEGNTIRLTERNVSRRHARIVRQNGAVEIEDLDSYNGIFINGNKLDGRIKLGEADRVQIGDYLIELKSDAPALSTEQKTQPMERIDPMANTPVPEVTAEQSDSQALTVPVETVDPETLEDDQPEGSKAQGDAPAVAKGPAYPQAEAEASAAAALADTDPGARSTAGEIARLVIVSNNFAGQEFSLDKPASVVGRTDDNDIVINHRSISRHHAKVVRENGRYAIVDLQSSNGVRVNGEEYGKVELRRGDNVDLGHVRLRFVEAGEDFVLGRDAEIVDLAAASAGGGRGFMWAAVAVLVIGGALVALLMRDDGTPTTTGSTDGVVEAPTSADPPAASPAAKDPTPTPPAVTPTPPPDPPPDPEPAPGDVLRDKLDAARAAILDEKWDVARDLAEEALAVDASSADAAQLREQATKEIANELQFLRFQQAIASQDWKTVPTTFAKIDRNSVYRPRAQEMHDAARADYVTEVRTQAQVFNRSGSCKAIADMARRAGEIWPEAGDAARAVLAECKAPRTVNTRRKPPRNDPPPAPEPEPETPRLSAQQLQQQSQEEYMRGNYGKAYKLCEDALEQNPRDPQARITCVLAACKMRNTKRATKHYQRLTADRQRMAYQQCKRSGVEFP